jgi:hypothetical protein
MKGNDHGPPRFVAELDMTALLADLSEPGSPQGTDRLSS